MFLPLACATLLPLVLATAPADDCTECTFDSVRTTLCRDHAKHESEVLRAVRKDLASDKPDVRRGGYQRIFELTKDHENAPSPKVVEALTAGLDDEDHNTRVAVLDHLLDGQHPEAVVKGLLASLKDTDKRWAEVDTALVEMSASRGTYDKNKLIPQEELLEISKFATWFDRLHEGLGQVPDGRVVKVLVKRLKTNPTAVPGHQLVATAKALIALGDPKGIEAVVNFLGTHERKIMQNKIPVRYPRSGPRRFMDLLLAPYECLDDGDFEAIAESLGKAAESRGSSTPPGKELGTAKTWKQWLAKNDQLFTTRLAKLATPLRVELSEPEPIEINFGVSR